MYMYIYVYTCIYTHTCIPLNNIYAADKEGYVIRINHGGLIEGLLDVAEVCMCVMRAYVVMCMYKYILA